MLEQYTTVTEAAEALGAAVAAAAPVLGDVVEARVLLGSLAALCLLTALRLVVDMLLFIHHASAHPKDTIGLLTHYLFKVSWWWGACGWVLVLALWGPGQRRYSCTPTGAACPLLKRVPLYSLGKPRRLHRPTASAAAAGVRAWLQVVDVPDSMQEVLLSCLIFYTVRLLVNRLAEMLPAPPAARRPPPRAPRTLSSANGDAGSGALGGAAGSPRSLLGGLRSEEVEAEGIKYEGYAEAIAAAQVRGKCWGCGALQAGPAAAAPYVWLVASDSMALRRHPPGSHPPCWPSPPSRACLPRRRGAPARRAQPPPSVSAWRGLWAVPRPSARRSGRQAQQAAGSRAVPS